jgi:hypothetical protein
LQVTFREPEAALRACIDPYPVIDGRRANCNLAYLGVNKSKTALLPPYLQPYGNYIIHWICLHSLTKKLINRFINRLINVRVHQKNF